MQPLRMFYSVISISIQGHLFECCANRQTWNAIISKTLTERTNKTIAIKYKVVYGLSIAIFSFDLEPLGRPNSNYLAVWIANLSKTVIVRAKMHKNERIYRKWFSPSNALIVDVLLGDIDLDSITIVRILCILAKFVAACHCPLPRPLTHVNYY